MSSRIKHTEIGGNEVRIRIAEIPFLMFAMFAVALAQGVESPPVTTFKPDTSLPKVNVPEFVITGKAETELRSVDKPSVEIDSSYFQALSLAGLGAGIPMGNSLSAQELGGGISSSLFARASIGSYTTTDYLISGSGGVSGYLLTGSLSGDYTSGFIPNTIQRTFSIQGGAEKNFEFDDATRTRNSADIAYSRSSYFFYGSTTPGLLRTADQFKIGLQSDMDIGEVPLMAVLGFDRFSLADTWKDVQSSIDFGVRTAFTLSSGNLSADGTIKFGNHTVNPVGPLAPILATDLFPMTSQGFDHPIFDLTVGTEYSNHLENLSYSLSLDYFQYRDDMSNSAAKLYPDLRGTYKLNGNIDLFSRFRGFVEEPSLSGFLATDRYVYATFPIRNIQHYANFTLGSSVRISNEVVVTPQINIDASRYFPFFISGAGNVSTLGYADRATVSTISITADYKRDRLNARATVNYRIAKADSLSSIPNLAPFDLNADASYQLTPRFTIGAYFLYMSERYSDLALTSRLGAAWLLNLHLSYDLEIEKMLVEIFAEGTNLFDQRYHVWQGYREFPLCISIGISSKIL